MLIKSWKMKRESSPFDRELERESIKRRCQFLSKAAGS